MGSGRYEPRIVALQRRQPGASRSAEEGVPQVVDGLSDMHRQSRESPETKRTFRPIGTPTPSALSRDTHSRLQRQGLCNWPDTDQSATVQMASLYSDPISVPPPSLHISLIVSPAVTELPRSRAGFGRTRSSCKRRRHQSRCGSLLHFSPLSMTLTCGIRLRRGRRRVPQVGAFALDPDAQDIRQHCRHLEARRVTRHFERQSHAENEAVSRVLFPLVSRPADIVALQLLCRLQARFD